MESIVVFVFFLMIWNISYAQENEKHECLSRCKDPCDRADALALQSGTNLVEQDSRKNNFCVNCVATSMPTFTNNSCPPEDVPEIALRAPRREITCRPGDINNCINKDICPNGFSCIRENNTETCCIPTAYKMQVCMTDVPYSNLHKYNSGHHSINHICPENYLLYVNNDTIYCCDEKKTARSNLPVQCIRVRYKSPYYQETCTETSVSEPEYRQVRINVTSEYLEFHKDLLDRHSEMYKRTRKVVFENYEQLCNITCKVNDVRFHRGSVIIEVSLDVDKNITGAHMMQKVVEAVSEGTLLSEYNVSVDSVVVQSHKAEHIRASSYTVKSLCDSIDDEIYLRPRDDTNRATLQIQIDSNELRNHTSSCACLFHVVEDTGFIGKLRTDLTIHDDIGNKFLSTDIGFEFCSDCCRVRRPYSYDSVWFQNKIEKDVRQFAVEIRQGLPMVSDTFKLHVLHEPVRLQMSCGARLRYPRPQKCTRVMHDTEISYADEDDRVLVPFDILVIFLVSILFACLLIAVCGLVISRRHKSKTSSTKSSRECLTAAVYYNSPSHETHNPIKPVNHLYEEAEYACINDKDLRRNIAAKPHVATNRDSRISVPNVYTEVDDVETNVNPNVRNGHLETVHVKALRVEPPRLRLIIKDNPSLPDYSLAGECVLKNTKDQESVRSNNGNAKPTAQIESHLEPNEEYMPTPSEFKTLDDEHIRATLKRLDDVILENEEQQFVDNDIYSSEDDIRAWRL